MKRSLEWHRQCLVNLRATLEDRKSALARMTADVERLRGEVALLDRQIQVAEERGMDAFDPNRLLRSKKKP
jgi:hypothetical protein